MVSRPRLFRRHSHHRPAAAFIPWVVIAGVLMGCGGLQPTNAKPTILVVSPPSNTTVEQNETVQVQFKAQNTGGIARVEMVADGDTLDLQNPTPTSPSFTGVFYWTPRGTGSHTVVLRAYSGPGTASDPAGIVVVVVESTPAAALAPTAEEGIPTTTSIPTGTLPETSAPPTSVPPTQIPPTEPPTAVPTLVPLSPTPTLAPTPAAPNGVPVITSMFIYDPALQAGHSTITSVSASDPDNDHLSYQWFVDAGPRADLVPPIGSAVSGLFQAPSVPSGLGSYTLRVVVSDGRGGTASATRTVGVVMPSNLAAAGPDFYAVWGADRTTQDKLGFAVSVEQADTANPASFVAAEEPFTKGYMFWFKADFDGVARIYVIYNADHTWQSFDDTWKAGVDPDFQCTTSPTPPVRGFGKVWCYQPGVADKVGTPVSPEIGEGQMRQKFQNGMIMRSLQTGTTYILFGDGTWK